MKIVVPDASVAAKWALRGDHEPLREEAGELLAEYARGEVRLVVPDLFWSELANVFWKAVRQGRWTAPAAAAALAALRERALPTVPSTQVVESALALALESGRSVYDCMYVAVAIDSKAVMVTADERLANALAARLPVKWLGGVSGIVDLTATT